MKNLRLKDILPAIEGTLYYGKKDPIIKSATDSYTNLKRGTLYFHINSRTIKKSLFHKDEEVIVVTEKPSYFAVMGNPNMTVVKVTNAQKAYWDFIKYYRGLFSLPVIGVTGTCGKTTTTEMLKTILSSKYNTQGTYDGQNKLANNLKYLLAIDEKTEAAVFEMAVIYPGAIEESCAYFQPDVGVLLNIGVYHLQGCGTLDNYIKAKSELLKGMGKKGKLIINGDDENIAKIDFSKFKGDIITFGLNKTSQFRAVDIRYGSGGMIFKLCYDNNTYPVLIQGYGNHNVYNALAAIAAANAAGIAILDAIAAISRFKQVRHHLQFCKGINGSTIIDDTWNCTPPSAKSALEVLNDVAKGRKKIAVIGYMPRLGSAGKGEYLQIGESVVKAGVDLLIVIGAEAKNIGFRAQQMGMGKDNIYYCNSGDEVLEILNAALDDNTIVLFKFPYKYRLSKNTSFRHLMETVVLSNRQ